MANENEGAAAQEKQVGIQRVYLKDCSFEAPGTPGVFSTEWKPQIHLNVSTAHDKIDAASGDAGDVYDVTLTVEVRAELNEKVAFLCEVKQSGLFLLRGLNEQELAQVMAIFCPTQLFPYAREVVSDLIAKGGFPAMTLQPINFEAMVAQRQQQMAAEAH